MKCCIFLGNHEQWLADFSENGCLRSFEELEYIGPQESPVTEHFKGGLKWNAADVTISSST